VSVGEVDVTVYETDEFEFELPSKSLSDTDNSEDEMASKFGSFGAFDETRVDIDTYLSRLKSTIIVSRVSDEHRIHAVISALGPKAFNTLRNLCSPSEPQDVPYDDCIKLFKEH
jgi:hypothetical protein